MLSVDTAIVITAVGAYLWFAWQLFGKTEPIDQLDIRPENLVIDECRRLERLYLLTILVQNLVILSQVKTLLMQSEKAQKYEVYPNHSGAHKTELFGPSELVASVRGNDEQQSP